MVHSESGDQTVILEGRAREIDATQVTYGVRPRTAFGWRERDFPAGATRWRFPR